MRALAVTILVVVATPASAAAEPVGPIGALGASGDLALTGGGSRRRVAAEAVAYLTRRYGVYAAVRRATVDPFLDEGQVTIGVAMRAAAARPTLELVVHADAGVAWPTAPVVGGGVTAYLWPLKRVPVALTAGLGAYLVIDGVDDTRLAVGLGLGLAIAR